MLNPIVSTSATSPLLALSKRHFREAFLSRMGDGFNMFKWQFAVESGDQNVILFENINVDRIVTSFIFKPTVSNCTN